jgi:hypothetical protein
MTSQAEYEEYASLLNLSSEAESDYVQHQSQAKEEYRTAERRRLRTEATAEELSGSPKRTPPPSAIQAREKTSM